MSENAELVRRWLAAMTGGVDVALAALPALMTEDFEHHPARKFPDSRPSRSRDDFADWCRWFFDAFSFNDWSVNELTPVGDDRILARVVLRAAGTGSGIVTEGELFQCYWMRDGRIARIEDHLTLDGASRALGCRTG